MKRKKSFFEKLTGAINTNEFEDDFELDESVQKNSTPQTTDEEGQSWEEELDGQLTVDVIEKPESIVVRTMVAGVKPDTLDIQIARDMVTIKGSRENSTHKESDNYVYQELYWGTFSRTILLPAEIEVEEAEAVEEHGLLTLTLPKIDKDRKTKLKVRSSR